MVPVLAILGPKAGKTGTPNNGICIITASSVCVKVPSCSRVKPLIPVWALAAYKQPERGQFISPRTTMMAVCALPAPGNGEMAVPVTELIPQQLGYFERGSAHTLELRSIYPLKDNRRRAVEKEMVYIVYSCYTGDFGPWARFRHMAGQKN